MTGDKLSILRSLFDTAVAAADPMLCIPANLPSAPTGRLIVIGAGKASARMAEAVEKTIGPCEGLVITRYGYSRPTQGIEIVEAAHPVPDDEGVRATQRMLELVNSLGMDDMVIALISGGGSALLCAPAGQITLAEKQAVNQALLNSGAPIDQMNTVRKHLSRVKGGQLAAAAYPAQILSLIISDVPGDDLAFIASGPTVGDNSTADDALAILEQYNIGIPVSVRQALSKGTGVLPPDNEALQSVENRIIAAPSQSLEAAAKQASSLGMEVKMLGDALEGEARELGARQAALAKEIAAQIEAGGAPVLLLSGGECTVTRRGDGVGGPNAEFLLSAAIELDGDSQVHALACDTDGVDGGAEVAGAIISPDTLSRASALGVSARDALDHNDSHNFFASLGDQVVPGPTLTNVNDFRAFLIDP